MVLGWRKLILIVSLTNGFWRSSTVELSVAADLRRINREVCMVYCDREVISECVYTDFYSARSMSEHPKFEACSICQTRQIARKNLAMKLGIKFQSVSNRKLPELIKLINNLNTFELKNFTWRDLPVGKYAAYELSLENKVEAEYIYELQPQGIKNSILNSVLILEEIVEINKNNKLEAIVFGNTLYSMNRPSYIWAKLNRIKTIDLMNTSSVVNRNTHYQISKDSYPSFADSKLKGWEYVKNSFLSEHEYQFVRNHLKVELSNLTIRPYSAMQQNSTNENNSKKRSQKDGSKNIFTILCLLSSSDERKTAAHVGVTHSKQFLSFEESVNLCLRIARKDPNSMYILRIHPRTFKNQFDTSSSKAFNPEDEIFENLPENVMIQNRYFVNNNFIESLLGVNLLLSFGTTAGVTGAALGLPVIYGSNYEDVNFAEDIYFYPKSYAANDFVDLISTLKSPSKALIVRQKSTYALRLINYLFNVLSLPSSYSPFNNTKQNRFVTYFRIVRFTFSPDFIKLLLNKFLKANIISPVKTKNWFIFKPKMYLLTLLDLKCPVNVDISRNSEIWRKILKNKDLDLSLELAISFKHNHNFSNGFFEELLHEDTTNRSKFQ